jgi:hypothetical protein
LGAEMTGQVQGKVTGTERVIDGGMNAGEARRA